MEKERDDLKKELRSFQLGEGDIPLPSEVGVQEQLDQAKYDVEALTTLARELETQNESLRSQSRQSDFTSQSRIFGDGSRSQSRQSQLTSSITYPPTSTTESRVPTPTPTDPLQEYYLQKTTLQNQLVTLTSHKNKLLWELSRLKPGPKSLLRGGELEKELDGVEKEVGSVRRQMRVLGVW